MANRNNTFLLKRSGVPGKIPSYGQLLLGELALNTSDAILYTSGTTANSILPIGWDRVARTGDTMTGTLYVPTISATTYLNFPPFTGGTVTGATNFTNGLTANTFSADSINTNYIDFNTGTTSPANKSGRVFFDNQTHSLAYFPDIDQNVKVEMGQQLYIRGYNNTGSIIPKGTVLSIQSATNGLPNFTPTVNIHYANSQVVGLAASDIPINGNGLALSQGILSGITINSFNIGDILYASPFSAGTYVADTNTFPFSARTNQIGYVIATGTTTGEIYVSINNEDENLTLTDIERNILEGNVISTGTYEFTGMTTASTTTFNIAPMRGWLVKNTYEYATLPDVLNLYYTGGTNIPVTNIATADSTYILITSALTVTQQVTFPTPQERRENIYLGKVNHPNRTSILNINNTVDYDVSPMSALRDLWSPIRLINQGIIPSPNGANLSFNTSAGTLWGNGINWHNNQLNPNSVSISGKTPASFFYRTQTGGTSSSVTVIDPTKYDIGGVITSISPAGSNDATNQRIYLYPTGVINVLYGQTRYATLSEAVAAIQSETFIPYPNAETNGILIGVISVRNDIVADGEPLTNPNYAKFTLVSKFGESFGGTGGLSTTTLQQAYDNSTTPEIITNATLGALSVKNGTGNADNVTRVFEGQASTNGVTSFIRADGYISGSTFQSNGFIANNDGVTATTVSASTLITPSFRANNGGITATTVSATTYYNLPNVTLQQAYTASTSPEFTINSTQLGIQFRNNTGDDNTPMIVVQNNAGIDKGEWRADGTLYTAGIYSPIVSATTYYNLPIDIRVTGGTYDNNTGVATFTNNTGGTFNVSGFGAAIFTGGTVTGPTNFTNGLTANTISATTYYNLPTDVFVTGGTYNSGITTLTNNTGGTFSISGFYTGSTDVFVTGGTYDTNSGTATLTNNTGGTFSISGFYTGSTDVFVTGGTYNDGTILFTNNTGGTFNVSGLYTGVTDVFVTGGTYSAGTAVFTNNTGGTFNVSGFSTSTATEFTGGTVTGSTIFTGGLNANTISATTYYNLPTDVYLTAGTYSNGIISFTNTTGGTFNVNIPANYAAGVISGATGWTSTGTGQINLPAVKVALYNNSNNIEPIMVYDVASGTTGTGGISGLTNNDTNYVVIEYNSGSPRYAVYDNDGVVDDSSVVLFMVVYRANNFVHTLEFGNQGAGLANKLNDRFIMTDRFGYESGLALGLSASTGVVTLSAGVVWNGPNRQSLSSINSQDDIFFKNFHSGGTWTYTTTASTINNTYYDDGTDIVVATGGKYLVNWYFRGQEINDHLYEVYGVNQYDSVALAQLSTEPSLPELITSHAILLGRIIVLVGANTGLTESAFITPFQSTQVTAHNDLNSIQGGTAGQYYHLTSTQYNNLALTNTDNNFSVSQTFNSGLKSSSVSATTYLNLPTDIRVTGGTYSNSVATFTNNTGGTFTVTGLTTPFTGGTVTGATNFTNGLTANTISATTYANLPTDIRVTGSTYNNNTFTYTNNTGGTFNVLFNTVTGLTTNGNLTVTGNTSMIGTLSVTGNTNVRAMTGTSATISGAGQSILTVIGSGTSTTSPLFTVQGSSGELFSVSDSLTGSLFSVNDISGLPILEVFSDNTTLMGNYLAPSLNTTTRVTLVAGSNTVYSIPTSAYTGAFFDYTVISTGTTGARAGTIMSIWSGTTAQYTDVSTNDIGTTTGVTFSVGVVGNNAILSSSATTSGWILKGIVRSI